MGADDQFECIGVWANQSRKCPLCSAEMAPFLLHDLDSKVPTKVRLYSSYKDQKA
jgi:E3 ubiquitin-protein ligase Topors